MKHLLMIAAVTLATALYAGNTADADCRYGGGYGYTSYGHGGYGHGGYGHHGYGHGRGYGGSGVGIYIR